MKTFNITITSAQPTTTVKSSGFVSPVRIRRGDILECTSYGKHYGDYYQLVRVMADVPASRDTITGRPSGQLNDVYNLVNTATGKTRISDPDRLLRVPAGHEPFLSGINSHFGMCFKKVTDVNTIGGDVKKAIDKTKNSDELQQLLARVAVLAMQQ